MAAVMHFLGRCIGTKYFVLAISLLLTACSTPDRPQSFPDVTFEHLRQLQVDAARIDIEQLYKSPLRSPNVEHLSPLSFRKAINTWSARRFVTNVNSPNHILISVKESSITSKALPMNTGISGALKKEQEFEYESVLDMTLQLVSPNGTVLADVASRIWQQRTVTEGLSQYEQRMVWLEMVEGAVNELDRQLETRLRQNFSDYIRF